MAATLQDLDAAIAVVAGQASNLSSNATQLVADANAAAARAQQIPGPVDYSAQVQAVNDIGNNLTQAAAAIAQADATVNTILNP